ncbi:hypothetical protein G9A89_015276 [Geosiphon pyriformis]|nr:hypothetical protein G9A89_015276 [Geosiphon pyriformis]
MLFGTRNQHKDKSCRRHYKFRGKKIRKCYDDYDASFNEFIDRSSEKKKTATTSVSESDKDEPAEVTLDKRKLKGIEGNEDEGGGIESDDQNDKDVLASSNNDLEELEDGENIEIDLKSIEDEL